MQNFINYFIKMNPPAITYLHLFSTFFYLYIKLLEISKVAATRYEGFLQVNCASEINVLGSWFMQLKIL